MVTFEFLGAVPIITGFLELTFSPLLGVKILKVPPVVVTSVAGARALAENLEGVSTSGAGEVAGVFEVAEALLLWSAV